MSKFPQGPSGWLRIVADWTPVLLWMGVIFLFSSQSRLPSLADPAADVVLKKGGHMAGYFVLSILVYRALRAGGPFRWQQMAGAALIAIAYAATDELHQSAVPGRNMSAIDLGIDSMGALLAVWLAWAGRSRTGWPIDSPGGERR